LEIKFLKRSSSRENELFVILNFFGCQPLMIGVGLTHFKYGIISSLGIVIKTRVLDSLRFNAIDLSVQLRKS